MPAPPQPAVCGSTGELICAQRRLAESAHCGHDAPVKMVRREPGQTTFALASASVLLAAVVVLSIRFESDPQEDGGLAAMLIMGVLLFVIPVGVAIYLMSTTNRAQIAAAAVTVVSSFLIATYRIGNLAALVYPVIALGSIVVLGGVSAVLRMTQRQRS